MCRCLWFACHLKRDFRVWALCTVFRVFRETILRVRICMGFFYSFRVWGLFLGFHYVFIVLVMSEGECSAYFYRLAVHQVEESEFCIWGLHDFAWRYYGSGLNF